MDKHIIYLVILIIAFVFSCLTGGLDVGCGAPFGKTCSRIPRMSAYIGLTATCLAALFMAAIFSALFTFKKYKWASYCEIFFTVAAAIVMMAAIIDLNGGSSIVSQIMGIITMTLAYETSVFLIAELYW